MRLQYDLPDGMGRLQLEDEVVSHLIKYRQKRFFSREAGGQLFARFEEGIVQVVKATGPRKSDRRSCFGYLPDRKAEQREIREQYFLGLHFVGDWHTHRESLPTPSQTDIESMRNLVKESSHDLLGFFLIVVGLESPPDGLHVSLYMRARQLVLGTATLLD